MSAVQDPRSLPNWQKMTPLERQALINEWDRLQEANKKGYKEKPELHDEALKTYQIQNPKKVSYKLRPYNGKDVLIQAGHVNTKTNVDVNLRGSTGAPGEVAFTLDVANQLTALLREKGFGVKQTDANANSDLTVQNRDWALALCIHYEADVHNTNGGFEAFPEPSTDAATQESQRIASFFDQNYFKAIGIPRVPAWRNANTSYYYLWKFLSAKTPCVLVECGVGWRVPKDSDILNSNRRGEVVERLARTVCAALGVAFDDPNNPTPPNPSTDLMPEYLKSLLAENGLDSEPKVRAFFDKARNYDGAINDKNAALSRAATAENIVNRVREVVK